MNPNCSNFVTSFKTLVINNFLSLHSPGAHCEADESDGSIASLKEFLVIGGAEAQYSEGFEEEDSENEAPPQLSGTYLVSQAQVYVTGYLPKGT